MNKLHEECGVFAMFSKTTQDLASMAYYGLYALQHRGQQSCGIVVNDDGLFASYKNAGLVGDVFTHENLEALGMGNMVLGHVRYGSEKSDSVIDSQPIVVNHIKGRMALSYNGCLTNAYELKSALELAGSIFHTTSDTEIMSYLITKERLSAPSIEEAVKRAIVKLDGAFAFTIMSPQKLIAVRDKYGLKPLCYGMTEDGTYVVASESCALDAVGAEFIRDILPGEIVVFTNEGIKTITDYCNNAKKSMCVFEYIYFARPDSVIDGQSVHEARRAAGRFLAKQHPVEADVVIGVPDSGLDAAIGYSEESGIPYGIGFLKNKYIGRTFIAPGQKKREDLVRIKLNPVKSVVEGKRVVMVDDSIVRGTTSARIVNLLREAGAKEVHFMVSSPPFIAPCYYGTDVGSKDVLVAVNHTVEEIRQIVGVDTLEYLSLDNCKRLCGNDKINDFCTACFDECYPTKVPTEQKKSKFEQKISDNKNKGE